MFKEHHPHIVITDNKMPIMLGIRMASEIKSLRPETIVVFLTGDFDCNSMQFLHTEGLGHYLQKPLNFKKLFSLIDRYVEGWL